MSAGRVGSPVAGGPAADGLWDDVVATIGSGVLAGVLAIVVVLAVSGAWIAIWSLWRTRGDAVKVE